MSSDSQKLPGGPIAFFEIMTHFGGSYQSLSLFCGQLRAMTDVVLVDAYGTCTKFHDAMKAAQVPTIALFANWHGQTTIGGTQLLERLLRMTMASWNMLRMIVRLRRVLRTLNPRLLSVTTEKALFVAWLAAPRHLPIVFSLHGELPKVRPYCIPAWYRADMVIGISTQCLNYLATTRYAHQNYRVVANGIDVDETLAKASELDGTLPICGVGIVRIVFPASLGSALKGHEVAIRALHAYCEAGGKANLWLCGDVPPGASTAFLDEMRRLVVQLGMEDLVHFLGWRTDMLAVMSQSDVVLLPSFTEGMPRCLLEAMALSKPVIATRIGGIPELVRDGIDGILVDAGDVQAVANAMTKLEDPQVRVCMGKEGHQRVLESFDLRKQAERFLHLLDSGCQQMDRL